MRFALITLGSLGDVLPFLVIAKELVRRQHDVELLTNPRFEALVTRHGVRFHPIGTLRDADRTEAHTDLWHPIRGLGVLWRYLGAPALKPSLARIEALSRSGQGQTLTVLASPLALGARVARELLPIRLITGYTAPMTLRSTSDPMFIGAWKVPQSVPPIARRGLWRLVDALKLHPMMRTSLLAWRADLGLPAIDGSIFGDWMPSPDGGLAMFPPWFAPAADDWLKVHHCGFPIWEGSEELSPELGAFLQAGAPPVLVYPGSGSRHASRLLATALDAIGAADLRAVLVSRHLDQTPKIDPASAIALAEVPFHLVLPRVTAIIHHGGIGTCAQAIRAGIPQLILPSAYDQFDNGQRVMHLGLGVSQPGSVSGQAIRHNLDMVRQPIVRRRTQELRSEFGQRDTRAASNAADWLVNSSADATHPLHLSTERPLSP